MDDQTLNVKDVIDISKNLITILGVIVGGLWAYYKFIKGRVFRLKLEPNVTAQIHEDGNHFLVNVSASMKNVGISVVDIDRDKSGLTISTFEVPNDVSLLETVEWKFAGSVPVFTDHGWIESGETINDKILFMIAKGKIKAFHIRLRVVARKISWPAEDIVLYTPEKPTTITTK